MLRRIRRWLSGVRAVAAAGRQPGAAAAASDAADAAPDPAAVAEANRAAAQRLWRLAFGLPAAASEQTAADPRVRHNVVAALQVDALNPAYLPRRPTLMPQLLAALNDPEAGAERVSRIIAHDPVLTVEVLRLANSSLYRVSPAPVESIQRAIVACGVDGLKSMLAAAMLRPVFRATARNFPRFPRVLWERTERAARAAELYALATRPQDRFEAQMVALLNALGPLAVYGAVLDVHARNPQCVPHAAACMQLIVELAPQMSLRIARDWEASARLQEALAKTRGEPLADALEVGELVGTLSFLASQTVLAPQDARALLDHAGLGAAAARGTWRGLLANG